MSPKVPSLSKPAEDRLRLRIVCKNPPPPKRYGAAFGLQDNSTTKDWVLHPGELRASGDIVFTCDCTARPNKTESSPDFRGPFVHGKSGARFLYLSWRPIDWRPGQPEPNPCVWVRRIKVTLAPITWEQIHEATRTGGVLEAIVPGTAGDGGPACASVPLIGGGWSLQPK